MVRSFRILNVNSFFSDISSERIEGLLSVLCKETKVAIIFGYQFGSSQVGVLLELIWENSKCFFNLELREFVASFTDSNFKKILLSMMYTVSIYIVGDYWKKNDGMILGLLTVRNYMRDAVFVFGVLDFTCTTSECKQDLVSK